MLSSFVVVYLVLAGVAAVDTAASFSQWLPPPVPPVTSLSPETEESTVLPEITSPNYPSSPTPVVAPDRIPLDDQVDPAVVQANMERLDDKLQTMKEDDVVNNMGEEIVNAILMTEIGNSASSMMTASTVASPSRTISDTADFEPCRLYARSVTSCARATSSFYSLYPTSQASCVCYSPSYDTIPCTPSITTTSAFDPKNYYQYAILPILDSDGFDDQANACRDFFDNGGYSNIASVLRDNGSAPGARFCADMNSLVGSRSGVNPPATATAQTGMKKWLDITRVGYCVPATQTPSKGNTLRRQHAVVIAIGIAGFTSTLIS